MFYEIGIDIVELDRIKKLVKNNDRFLLRVFTEKERELFLKRKNNLHTIAANFSAKEAVAKAFGHGIGFLGWRNIEILRDENGKPIVNLYGRTKEIGLQKGIMDIRLTISHSKEYAVAFCLIIGGGVCEGCNFGAYEKDR